MANVAHSPATRKTPQEPGQPRAAFGRVDQAPATRGAPDRAPAGPDFEAIQSSAEFVSLRRRLRGFIFPLSVLFFLWYMTYVLLAAYAHDFMSRKVFGQVNVGILLGVGQFASTALVTWLYLRYARRHLDPRVAELRARAGLPEGPRR
jgi:uncharacterized membrane protein (DUF485 family)